jgi:hypothetical protein
MAHTYGSGGRIPTSGLTTSSNPATESINLPAGTTVLWVSIVVGGTTARAGGDPTFNGIALTAGNAKTNAGGTPEVCAEDWYLRDPPTGTSYTLSIPNSGTLGMAVAWGYASAASGFTSVYDNKVSTPGNSNNPSTSFTVADGAIWFGAVGNGAQTWNPSGRSGTQINDWDAGSWGRSAQYGIKSGSGSQTVSWTFGTSEDWIVQGISFKEQALALELEPPLIASTATLYAPGVYTGLGVLWAGGVQGGWYDPSDLGTLWQDTAGTTPVTATGQAVARIDDKSGNGNHAVQATEANRPILRQDDGLYYLEFDGVNDFLQKTSAITLAENHYWGGAFQLDTRGGINTALFSSATSYGAVVNSADACGIYQRSDVVERVVAGLRIGVGSSFVAEINSAFSIGSPFIGEAYHEGDTLYASNTTSSANVAADDNNTSANHPISIGSDGHEARFYGGLVVMRALTSGEKDDVRDYLAGLISPPIAPPFLASTAALYTPALTAGPVGLTAPLIASTAALYSPAVAGASPLLAPFIASAAALYSPTVAAGAVSLLPPLIASAATLHAPTLSTGPVGLAAPLIASAATLFPPAFSSGATLTAPFIAAASAIYAPTVAPGALTLAAPLIASAATLYAPLISPGAVTLSAPLIASVSALFAPTLAAGVVTLAPPLIAATSAVFAPGLTSSAAALIAPFIAAASVLFAPRAILATLTQQLNGSASPPRGAGTSSAGTARGTASAPINRSSR